MKKVLLASTALVMTAGMAAADVSLSGYAEIGVKDNGDEVVFHNDIDVTFTLSGETDGGLAFGATIDLDEITNAGDDNGIPDDANDSSVFVSGDFGTITMGDTDGAFDWALTEIAWGTTLADDHTTHAGWSGNSGLDGGLDGQVARYDYTFGDFAFAISAEIGEGETNDDEIYGIGFKYAADLGGIDLGVGLGYQEGSYAPPTIAGVTAPGAAGDADIVGMSLSAAFANGFQARLNYSSLDGEITSTTTGTPAVTTPQAIEYDWDHWGVGVGYQMDALLVEVNYGVFDGDIDGVGGFEADGYGLSVNYDLGGGAVVMVGYGHSDGFALDGVDIEDQDTWSAGLGLSF